MARRWDSRYENMFPELTHLLPNSRIRAFRRGYFLRVGALFCMILTTLVIVHGLMLLPSYLFAHAEVKRENAQLAGLNASLQTSEEKEVRTRLTQLSSNVTYLNTLSTTTAASAALRAVLAVPRTGITLSGFTFAPPTATQAGHMGITGMAATRDTLRAYALALGALPFVTNADLPISAYAKEDTIPFTITLTGSLRP
jgi:Tfp pilus assembly protein PilN